MDACVFVIGAHREFISPGQTGSQDGRSEGEPSAGIQENR